MYDKVDTMGEEVKNVDEDSLCAHRDSNRIHHYYNSNALTLNQTAQWLNLKISSL
jgi:hypothetical protein